VPCDHPQVGACLLLRLLEHMPLGCVRTQVCRLKLFCYDLLGCKAARSDYVHHHAHRSSALSHACLSA